MLLTALCLKKSVIEHSPSCSARDSFNHFNHYHGFSWWWVHESDAEFQNLLHSIILPQLFQRLSFFSVKIQQKFFFAPGNIILGIRSSSWRWRPTSCTSSIASSSSSCASSSRQLTRSWTSETFPEAVFLTICCCGFYSLLGPQNYSTQMGCTS